MSCQCCSATACKTPELFQRYVVASFYPDLAWEDEYAKRSSSLPVRLHLVMEDMTQDQVLQHRSFVDRLRGRNYTGLRLTEQVLPNSTHCGSRTHFRLAYLQSSPSVLGR